MNFILGLMLSPVMALAEGASSSASSSVSSTSNSNVSSSVNETISRFLFSHECPRVCQPRPNSLNHIIECVNEASMKEMFEQIVLEQSEGLDCEWKYFSREDHRGSMNSRQACARAGGLGGLSGSVRTTFENMQDPMVVRAESKALQARRVDQILDDAYTVCQNRKEISQKQALQRRRGCVSQTASLFSTAKSEIPGGFAGCELNARLIDMISIGATSATQSLETDAYVDSIVGEVGEDCLKLGKHHVWRKSFRTIALSPWNQNSYQRRVVDAAKTRVCTEQRRLKNQDEGLNSYLSIIALLKMKSDPEFGRKFGYLECDLRHKYGNLIDRVNSGATLLEFVSPFLISKILTKSARVVISLLSSEKILKYNKSFELISRFLIVTGIQMNSSVISAFNACRKQTPQWYLESPNSPNACGYDMGVLGSINERAELDCVTEVLLQLVTAKFSVNELDALKRGLKAPLWPQLVGNKFSYFNRIGTEANLAFIGRIQAHKGQLFVSIENTLLKNLNDSVSKKLSTGVTNLNKTLLMNAVLNDPILKANLLDAYSDYKAVKFVFRNQPHVATALQDVYRKLQDDYVEYFEHSEFTALFHSSGNLTNPRNWFRGGIGTTLEEADVASRSARRADGGGYALTNFHDEKVLGVLIQRLESLQSSVRSLGDREFDKWLDAGALVTRNGRRVPSVELSALYRKQGATRLSDSEFEEQLKNAIKKQFGIEVQKKELAKIIEVFHSSDVFMPSLLIPKEPENLSLINLTKGFMFFDSTDIGAMNMTNLIAETGVSRGLDEALQSARRSSAEVDGLLVENKNRLNQLRDGNVLTQMSMSGDDAVISGDRENVRFLDLIGKFNDIPTGVRTTAVSPVAKTGGTIDTSRFDGIVRTSEELQKKLTTELRSALTVREGKGRWALFVHPGAQISGGRDLSGASLEFVVDRSVSSKFYSEFQRQVRKLATEFGVVDVKFHQP